MIKIENLSKDYRTIQALKGINLHVREGELPTAQARPRSSISSWAS